MQTPHDVEGRRGKETISFAPTSNGPSREVVQFQNTKIVSQFPRVSRKYIFAFFFTSETFPSDVGRNRAFHSKSVFSEDQK